MLIAKFAMKSILPKASPLKSSLDILNSTRIFVLIGFAISLAIVDNLTAVLGDPLIFLSEITKFSLTKSYSFIFPSILTKTLIFLLAIVKILIYSGMYGSLVELASGQEMVLTFKNFRKNIKKFWPFYFVLTTASLLINKIFILLEKSFLTGLTEALILYILAYLIIFNKYLRPAGLAFRKTSLNLKNIFFVIVLIILNAFAVNISLIIPFDRIILVQVSILISTYIHFLIFIYLSSLILKAYPEIEDEYSADKELYLINLLWRGILPCSSSMLVFAHPPFFVVLKALTPENYKIRKFNRVIWRKRYYKKAKLVAISCSSSNSYKAYKIAKEFKKAGSTVIMGGPHVTYNPDEALEYCDSVVIGEVEGVWGEVIRDYGNNSLKKKYIGYPKEDFYKETHKELMNSEPSVIRDFLETTRGCKFNCEFCSIPALSGHKIRHKPIDEVIELIKKIKQRYKLQVFMDNNIFADPVYSKELFRKLIPLKIKWAAPCSVDIAKDEEALKLAKQSGCRELLIGYEIIPYSVEKEKGGKFLFAKDYLKLSRKISKVGIRIRANFILGFDSNDFKYLFRLWLYCLRMPSFRLGISLLTPFPGTRLYQRLIKEGRIATLNWRYYDGSCLVFKHVHFNRLSMILVLNFMKYFILISTSTLGRVMFLLIIIIIYFKL